MIRLKALAVKDYGPFTKQVSFQFKPGISVVYGLNHTSGNNSKNSNWVGKSLFFSSLSEVLYGEPIVGTKQDVMKAGSIAVSLVSDQKKIQIIRRLGKKSVTEIIENGVKIEHLTKTKAQEYINSVWDLSQSEFETFVHIDSRIPHPLVMGSSTDRKHFFDSFFKLSTIDYERRAYLSALRQVEAKKQTYTELLRVYKQQTGSVLSADIRQKYEHQLAKLKVKQQQNSRDFELITRYRQLSAVYDSLSDKLQGIDLQKFQQQLQQIKSKLSKLNQIQQQWADYKSYVLAKKRYNRLLSDLSELAVNTPLVKLSKGSQLYLKYTEQLEELDEPLDIEKPKERQNPGQSSTEMQVQISKLEDMLRSSLKFKSGICPTCGQPVKTHNIQQIKRELIAAQTKLNKCVLYEQYLEQLEQYKVQVKANKQLIQKRAELTAKVEKFKPYRLAYKERVKLPEEPVVIDKPSIALDMVQAKVEKLSTKLHTMQLIEPNLQQINEYLSWSGITQFDTAAYNECNEQVAKLEAQLSLNESSTKQVTELKERLKTLKTEVADEKWLRHLVQIFSDKQLKRLMVQQISEKLCQLMNGYANLVFNTEYRFQLIWDTQLQLLCTRKVGRHSLTSDVRKLSGAESKLFTLILILSLLSFVPPARRPNVIILDEPSANMSVETTQAFIKLLDVLKHIIPSIVIITPRDDIYPDSIPYTVVRTKNGSQIVEGLPDQVSV